MSESHHPKVSRGPRQLAAVLPSSSLSGGANATTAHLAPDQARAGFRQKCNVLQGSTNKALFTLPANSGRSPPCGSRPDADPQAAEQSPAHPGLHVESPAGLGHEHARRQAAQQQQ